MACTQNAIRLEEKERSEKERLHQIMDEAESFREEFYSLVRKTVEILQSIILTSGT